MTSGYCSYSRYAVAAFFTCIFVFTSLRFLPVQGGTSDMVSVCTLDLCLCSICCVALPLSMGGWGNRVGNYVSDLVLLCLGGAHIRSKGFKEGIQPGTSSIGILSTSTLGCPGSE